ncbi:MAG: type IV pilus secretin PilQ [Proteobacteria bacterium]|nr:type IV pilus secretin PilQ [Pseudomonadota bacterium]
MNLKAKGWLAVAVAIGFFFALSGESGAKKNWDNTITNISVSDSENAVVITLKGQGRPTYTAFKLNDPARIVIDLANTDVSAVSTPAKVDNGFVGQVSAAQITEQNKDIGRIEIGLLKPLEYDARSEGNDMVIQVFKAAPIAPAPAAPLPGENLELPPLEGGEIPPLAEVPGDLGPSGAPAPEIGPAPAFPEAAPIPPLAEVPPPAESPAAPAPAAEEVAAGGKATKILDFRVSPQAGATEIQIVGNGEIKDYSAFKLENPPRFVVDIMDVGNLYPATEIPVSTPELKMIRIGQHPDKLRLVFEPANGGIPPYQVKRQENRLVIRMGQAVTPAPEGVIVAEVAPAPPEIPPYETSLAPAPEAPAEVPPLVEAPLTPVAPAPVARPKPAAAPVARVGVIMEESTQPRFTGRKMDIEFREGEIIDALRVIADVAKLNIVAGEDVKGRVTLKLVNVPWDQALDLILKSNMLGMERVGNVIRIAPAEKLRNEMQEMMKAEKTKEEIEPLITKIIPVNYGPADGYSGQIKGLLSTRGTVDVDRRTNVLIVKDIVRNVQSVAMLIKNLDTQTPQVLIEARIVEASTNLSRDLGVQWGGRFNASAASGNPTGLPFPNSIGIGGGIPSLGDGTQYGISADPFYAVNLPAAVSLTSGGGAMGFTFGSINSIASLDLRLSAMEGSGEGRVISSPRIVTMDNQEAQIKQGLSIPYESVSTTGTQTQFIDAVLSLTVTPHITADRSVIMKIKAEKNAPDTTIRSASGVPSVSKKEAKSDILVKDGETVVIGGIYTIEKTESHSRIPFFSSIPILGWLFRRDQTVNNRTELLIFITPRIVEKRDV